MLPLNYYFALPYCSLCKLAFLNIIPSIQTSEIGGKTLKLYFSVLHNVIAHKTSPPITKAGCWNEHYSFVIRLVFFFFLFPWFHFQLYLSVRMHRKNGQFASVKESFKMATGNWDPSSGTPCPEYVWVWHTCTYFSWWQYIDTSIKMM